LWGGGRKLGKCVKNYRKEGEAGLGVGTFTGNCGALSRRGRMGQACEKRRRYRNLAGQMCKEEGDLYPKKTKLG